MLTYDEAPVRGHIVGVRLVESERHKVGGGGSLDSRSSATGGACIHHFDVNQAERSHQNYTQIINLVFVSIIFYPLKKLPKALSNMK